MSLVRNLSGAAARLPFGKASGRRAARGLIAWLFRLRAYPMPSSASGTTLVIAPHPDDESLGCGGLIAERALRGEQVRIVFLTDGDASHPGFPPATVGARRREEARHAAAVLGLGPEHLFFLDFPDGQLEALAHAGSLSSVQAIADLIGNVGPAEVFVPYAGEGSTEHEAAHILIRRALTRADHSATIYEYFVWAWWNPILLFPALLSPARLYAVNCSNLLAAKERAVRCHASQLAPIHPGAQSTLSAAFVSCFLGRREFFRRPPLR